MIKHARKAQFLGGLDPHSIFRIVILDVVGQLFCNISYRLLQNRYNVVEQHVS